MNTKEALEIRRIKSAAELLSKLASEDLSSVEVQQHLSKSSQLLYAIAQRKMKAAKRRSKEISTHRWSLEAQKIRMARNHGDGKPLRTGFPWETDEVKRTTYYFNSREKTLVQIAELLQRSLLSVVVKLHQVGRLTDSELSYFYRKREDFIQKDMDSVLKNKKIRKND